MTHGQTPTARCWPARAVRLAFQELGDDQDAGALVVAGRKWRPELTPAEVLRVLERKPRHGAPRYALVAGKWRRAGAAVEKAALAREERGLAQLDKEIAADSLEVA